MSPLEADNKIELAIASYILYIAGFLHGMLILLFCEAKQSC